MLQIRLFGELELRMDGELLEPLESARAASLLAYLLLHHGAPQQRQHLAFRLWPDSTEAQARTNLRHVLHTLRRVLPDADRLLDIRARTLQWRPDAPCWLDVAEFDAAIARAERESEDALLATLRTAVGLHRGALLESSYDEWLDEEREPRRRHYLGALERLASLLASRGEHGEAIAHAERLLRHDPLREDVYRLLMRLHDARGDRARAVHVYHGCTAVLERELGVQPSAATREAYEALLTAGRDAGPPVPRTDESAGWPLVGRPREWDRLTSIWRATETGRAQLVLVTGEPGVGKTRLVEELRAWCAHRGAATAEARSYLAEGALAYAPLVAWLRSEAVQGRLGRLDRGRLAQLARLLPELAPQGADLRHVELPDADRRHHLFDAAARAMLAPGPPLLLVAEDVQWCDRDTLQFLHYLLRVQPDARLLVAATARREDLEPHDPVHDLVAGLATLDRCIELPLDRLTPDETATLAEKVAGRRAAVPDADQLYGETGGNPLFVVEAVRAGWHGVAEPGRITPKVQAVIGRRLAQLSPPARHLVEAAAVVGREFAADVLARVARLDDTQFVSGLDELWRRGIVRERGPQGYDFSHDRIREVAYAGLSPAARRRHHLRVAQAIEQSYPDAELVSAQLAAHYEHAGVPDAAVTWYERAAATAQRLGASAEVVRLLERALGTLASTPDGAERQARELSILTTLPAFIGAAEGYASPRMAVAQRRALDLARTLGVEPAPQLLRTVALMGLSRGDFAEARRAGHALRERAERDADDVSRVEAAYILGISAFWQGELHSARRHFEEAVTRYSAALAGTHLVRYGLDPKAVCLSRLANTLWLLGMPTEAEAARDAALALAEEMAHPHTRAVVTVFTVMLALDMRDHERFRRHAATVAGESADAVGPHVWVAAEAFSGYMDVLDGRTAAGVARIQRAASTVQGDEPAPGTHALLARVLLEACSVAGDARTGLDTADRALAMGRGIFVWEAEVRRLRAAFLAALGAPAGEVEAELARAADVARTQGAESFLRRIRHATDAEVAGRDHEHRGRGLGLRTLGRG